METIAILLLIGFGIYQVLKLTTKMGMEATRAFLYLKALDQGTDSRGATAESTVDALTMDPEDILAAKAFIRQGMGGKQLPMIRLAYKAGMKPELPGWYVSRVMTMGG